MYAKIIRIILLTFSKPLSVRVTFILKVATWSWSRVPDPVIKLVTKSRLISSDNNEF